MHKIKTSELTGSALDWAVAKCERREGRAVRSTLNGTLSIRLMRGTGIDPNPYSPSTTWAQGGPIIEREGIHTATLASGIDLFVHQTFKPGDKWEAELMVADRDSFVYTAPTPLVAAMRCYVASKLGDEVEVPEELL